MRWVVRVVTQGVGELDRAIESGTVLQFLAVAGLVRIHRLDHTGACFDVMPVGWPDDRTKDWSETLAEGLRENGLNAVSAPEFPHG